MSSRTKRILLLAQASANNSNDNSVEEEINTIKTVVKDTEARDFSSDDSIQDRNYVPSSDDSFDSEIGDDVECSSSSLDSSETEDVENETVADSTGKTLNENEWTALSYSNDTDNQANRRGILCEFSKKMKKGEVYGEKNGCLKILKWIDKRQVLMLTTDPSHDINLVNNGKLSRKGDDIKKPKAVLDYNKAKKGVDYSDQMFSYHSVLRKGLKWYRKLVFELLFGTSIVNAWIIYNKLNNTKMSITEFRKTLAREMVVISNHVKENIAK